MKTSILYSSCANPERACLPHEVTGEKSTLIRKGRFIAKGTLLGKSANGKDWIAEHDQISFSGYNVKGWLNRGTDRPACDAKVIEPEFVEQLHDLDEQILTLNRKRREVIEEAWQRGRKLNRKDIGA